MTILDKFILLNLRTISEYKLDDLVKAVNHLVKDDKKGDSKDGNSKCSIEFSEYWLDFMIDMPRDKAREYLNDELSPRIFLKFVEN